MTPRGQVIVAALAAVAVPAAAAAAPARVHSDTHEVRACLPLATGGALVGTGGGLVLVDASGVQRAVWTARDGLPGTRIESIVREGDQVWIGADGGGARIRIDGEALAVTRSIAGAAIRDLVRHDGALYAATWNGGVVKLGARGKGVTVPFKGGTRAARGRVAALVSSGGSLWAGTAAGLFQLRGGRLEPVTLGVAHPNVAITSMYAGPAAGSGPAADRLWIATTDGLLVRDGDGVRDLGGGHVTRVTAVDGAIVVAGLGEGLRRVDRGRLIALDGAPAGLVLAQALSEHDGGACAGGLDGLWLRPGAGAAWRAAPHADGLLSNDVSALAADGERLWVGTFDHGLAVHERGAWRTVAHPDLDGRINAVLVEPRPGKASRLWVATAAGLMTLDGDAVGRLTRRDGLPGRSVLALTRLRDGRIVAGTSTGAVIVTDARPAPLGPPGTEIGNVWAVAEDVDGMIWLGTTTGVWRGPSTAAVKAGDRGTGWQRFAVATGHLDDDWVMAIAARGRSVWVGGYKGGVVRFDLGDAGAAMPSTAARLGGGWINPGGLRWDGDTLYASTQEGLRSGDGTTATWTTATGLPGKDVTAALRVGATHWIATRRGLLELPRLAP